MSVSEVLAGESSEVSHQQLVKEEFLLPAGSLSVGHLSLCVSVWTQTGVRASLGHFNDHMQGQLFFFSAVHTSPGILLDNWCPAQLLGPYNICHLVDKALSNLHVFLVQDNTKPSAVGFLFVGLSVVGRQFSFNGILFLTSTFN